MQLRALLEPMSLLIKKTISTCVLLVVVFVPLSVGAVFADSLQASGKAMGYGEASTSVSFSSATISEKIGKYIQLLLSFIGVVFLVLAIYAGYLWMMAQGNEKDVEKAKKILSEVAIGLLIVTSAYVISGYVTDSLNLTLN